MVNPQIFTGYQAALDGVVCYPVADGGYLRVSGPDQASYLQRQTTNDVQRLAPNRAVLTVLTSPTARILDVFYLIREPTGIGLITLPGRSGQTFRYLKSRIFFMDKVTLDDQSAQFAQFLLIGSDITPLLVRLGVERSPEVDEIISVEISGAVLRILGLNRAFGMGLLVLAEASNGPSLRETFSQNGVVFLDPDGYAILRVEAGLPGPTHELIEEFTPLETGLEVALSSTKGCYTGQEIIARQVTYDKVTQTLCGLRLSQEVQPGDRIWSEGKPAGIVTSAVQSPRFGLIALAIVKRPHNQPGERVMVGSASENGAAATVEELPFR